MRFDGGELRPDDLGAALAGDALGLAADGYRQRDPGAGSCLGHEGEQREQRLLRTRANDPSSSTTVPVSPSGSMTMPRSLADGAHELADPLDALEPVVGTPPRPRRRERVDGEDVCADLCEHRRHDQRRRTERVVEHHLERPLAQPALVDARLERGRVVLERAGREHDVADVAGERAAEVLALEQPLDLALPRFVDVATLVVEDADLHAVRVPRREPHGDATVGHRVPHLEPGQRDRGQLDVLDVHPGQVQPADDRALQRSGHAARVAARRDHRALLERRAVGHRQPGRDLGRDVDVGEPRDPAPAEQRARTAALPDDRRGDDRTGFDRLERVDLDAGVHDRAFADEALVAEHRTLLDRARALAGRTTGR